MNTLNELHPFQEASIGGHPGYWVGHHQGGPGSPFSAPWMQSGANMAYAGQDYGDYGEWEFGSKLAGAWKGVQTAFSTDGAWDMKKIGQGVAVVGTAALLIKQIRGDLQSARAEDEARGTADSDARVQALEMQLAELNRRALEAEQRPQIPWMPILAVGGAVATLVVVMVMMKGGKKKS